MTIKLKYWPLLLILLAYFTAGTLYAVQTPNWQVPDEPAHYNYVRTLAEQHQLPVMTAQDYDQSYIEQLTSEQFPPQLPIAPLTYEDHQPPLYYLLATPVFWLGEGRLLPLRLFSLTLGAMVVVITALMASEIFPQAPGLSWLAAGLVALLPQHLAMMAGVNNDSLTEALLACWLWLALRYLRGKTSPLSLGVVLGALLLTKTTGYVALPLALLVIVLRWRRGGFTFSWALRQAVALFLPGLLLGALWWTRNSLFYGWPDILGLQRHNAVVVGQPRTADWIARNGLVLFLRNALRTTFRSFWGQFGWMGVVLDQRIYLGMGLLSGLMLWGAMWQAIFALRRGISRPQQDTVYLLGAATLITFALPFWYNLTFVQHQGRYLFPALPALALSAALGLRQLTHKRLALITALLLVVVGLISGGVGLLRGDLPLWTLLLVGSAALLTALSGLTAAKFNAIWGTLLLGGLFGLDMWCLFRFIVPLLS
ncbi:MAG: glycosyltransferase family 39 protein [Chloroflexota bacterium]|nr:glycosyltransferase family 39 protein [Chloroflexota bacterium]